MEEESTIIREYIKTIKKPPKRITIEKTETTTETLEGPIEKCPTCKQYYIPTLKK